MAQSKVELILEMRSRLKTGLSRAKQSVNSNVDSMKRKFSNFKISAVKNLRSIASEVPIVGRAFQLLKNPIVLATGLILGLGVALSGTVKKAQEFEHAFLPIKQLNLDKSAAEMKAYQDSIKSAAFDTGANLAEATQSVYDIQSATGLYGKDAIDIFKKVSDFSLVTGANIADSTNSVTKSMKAMGLEVKDIDTLLASNAKTVQLGITTFDQLAKVQTEYTGAAAGAGQSIDTANKLFSVFTSVAKDSASAATLTKTAFQGLTQKATVDALKKMGVNMFDAKGNVRELGTVLGEVSDKFKDMSPKGINDVINKIGGPEGLRALFTKLGSGADDLFNTFEQFDKTEFNFAKAMNNAMLDATTIAKMAKNRKDIIAVEIGEKFLPMWVTVLEKVNNALKFVWRNFETIVAVVRNVGIALAALKTGMIIFNIVTSMNPVGAIITAVIALIALITFLITKFEGWGDSWKAIKTIVGIVFNQIKLDFNFIIDNAVSGVKLLMLRFKAMGQFVQQLFGNIGKAIQLALNRDFSGAKAALTADINTQAGAEIDALKESRERQRKEYIAQTKANVNAVIEASKNIGIRRKTQASEESQSTSSAVAGDGSFAAEGGETIPGAVPSGSDSINKIAGSAKQIKNITINIDSFVKGGINSQNTEINNMSPSELEEWFNNMMLRVIRNVELSY